MKTMKFLTYTVFVLFLSFSISSCTGDDGADGADGINGVDGADGQDGQDGEDGEDGNANVIYSDWIVPNWTAGSFYSWSVQEYNINTPELTQDVVDFGIVLVYWKNYNNDVWLLPHVENTIQIENTFSLNNIYLYYYYPDNPQTTPSVIPASNVFRYVLIPGNVPGGKSTANPTQTVYNELESAGVDVNNYYDVCYYYGIDSK